ncbi:MAG: hypothetical protein HY985_09910 [Magnetospirillum sp.]|nr:hypothetical protein [Magnetospirillum sp.]
MEGSAIRQERFSAKFARLITGLPILVLTVAGTFGAAWLTFLIGGALLFSGKPQPTPFALYPALALVVLLLPMIVSLILRASRRGRSVVVAVQAALLLGNGLFWIGFLVEFNLWG